MEGDFSVQISQGIPKELPPFKPYSDLVSHAPSKKNILSVAERKLAIKNALRYFPVAFHHVLAQEFYDELMHFGKIYMYRFRPDYPMYARSIEAYPAVTLEAAAIMLMIQNNLDPKVAQHPHELITYGGNGAVFQNWAQYLLTMQYLSQMTSEQTLHMYSGHPMGLFPSSKESPSVVITNGMMVPHYSTSEDLERYNALGVTQYGQMTAGSYMYIGPQGIVHGTHITILNAVRKIKRRKTDFPPLFLSSGLGGMSGAQPKAGVTAGLIAVVAEINPKVTQKRYEQGWVGEVIDDLNTLVNRVHDAQQKQQACSIAYQGNVVDVWEKFYEANIHIDIGSDQTSLHNPWSGGYYPVGMSYDQSNQQMKEDPKCFREQVRQTLCRHVEAVNKHTKKGTYFFDYGNAFLLEASRAGAAIMSQDGILFRYPSYVQDIMGPICFDYGFGPFRWVCASGRQEDLDFTDDIATEVLQSMLADASQSIVSQIKDNILWIKSAKKNNLVVGSKARILYADAVGRMRIAKAFNQAIKEDKIGPIILGRDHHDVSGTDSPFRETSNIYDGSKMTADMAIQNVIGDSFRGATWVSIHNGGGVGWGEAINGGFGMLLDGSEEVDKKITCMLYFDVNNGLARRAWAGSRGAASTIAAAQHDDSCMKITMPYDVDPKCIDTFIT